MTTCFSYKFGIYHNELPIEGDLVVSDQEFPWQTFDIPSLSWVGEAPDGPTEAEISVISSALESAMTAAVQIRLYKTIDSACSYASDTSAVAESDPTFALCEKFRLEGIACRNWRSQIYATSYLMLAQVKVKEIPMPTVEEAVAMMPELQWPD